MADPNTDDTDEKGEKVETRLPASVKKQAQEKASKRGWRLSSVMRALIELWIQEDVITGEDVGRAEQRNKRITKA